MKQNAILDFLHELEGLKKLLRHSWLSNGRQESVAEHTWRLSMMAVVLHDQIEEKVDIGTVLKMITVHDIAEIYAGDHHAFKGELPDKYQKEQAGIKKILSLLNNQQKETELYALWEEYEACKTPEAKFAKALDKIEALIQHNEADISTWTKEEYDFNFVYGHDKVAFSEYLKSFLELVNKECRLKIEKNQN